MAISRPVLENYNQQFHNSMDRNLATRKSKQNLSSNPTTKGRENSRHGTRKSKDVAESPGHNSTISSPQNEKHKKSGKQLKKDASIGRVSAKLGLKLKKQPPPLPKSFEASPLFDTNLTSQYFRIQPDQSGIAPQES